LIYAFAAQPGAIGTPCVTVRSGFRLGIATNSLETDGKNDTDLATVAGAIIGTLPGLLRASRTK